MSVASRRGRPRKRRALAELIDKLGRTCRADQSLTRLEEVVAALFERAVGGDVAAAKLLLAYLEGTPVARVQAEVGTLPLFNADDFAAAERRSLDYRRQRLSADPDSTDGSHGSHGSQFSELFGAV